MSVSDILLGLPSEARKRAYFTGIEVLEQTSNLVKARMYITPTLFIQVYRNDRYDTTNFALVHNEKRLCARDKLGGIWHRHVYTDPENHDTSPEGQKDVSLSEFLDEVETVLVALDLP